MAKTFYVSPGRSYTVTASEGTTITYPGITKPAATVGSTGSVTFNCTATEIVISDNNAKIAQNFNNAGAAVAGAGGGSGSTEGVALLEGGNSFSGDQTISGDVTIDGTVTIAGDVTAEGEYNGAEVIETMDTTIIPDAGKYYKYTGTGDTITVTAPVWNGYMTISYLETATPVELQGVIWSPAKPSLTGAGPFVYTLVCAESGSVLASVMNYSVATVEAIQQVVPIAWGTFDTPITIFSNSLVFGNGSRAGDQWQGGAIVIGHKSNVSGGSISIGNNNSMGRFALAIGDNIPNVGQRCVAIGHGVDATSSNSIVIGSSSWDYSTKTTGLSSLVIGHGANISYPAVINLGILYTEETENGNVTHKTITEGTGSITIGAGAKTLNGDTESSNSVTIGCKAENKGADSVVIGAQAKATAGGTVAIGAGAEAADAGAVVFASYSTDRSYKTQLYFSGAGSALANTYANGEGIMGYVTTDSAGNVIASGYKKLSALFDEGSMTQPATLDEFGDWVMPKVFHPSDLDMPTEEPTEPEEYKPLPVYPIVEPEISSEPSEES